MKWDRPVSRDPLGRVFEHEGEFYRAIRPAQEQFVRELFKSGVVDELVDLEFLPPHGFAELNVEGFPFTLRAERATFDIRPGLYPLSVLKEAALKWVDASLLLEKRGLCIVDGHTWNSAYYNNSKPKWFDFGSIQSIPGRRPARAGVDQFLQYYLYPLLSIDRNPHLYPMIRAYAIRQYNGLAPAAGSALTGWSPDGRDWKREELLLHVRELLSGLRGGDVLASDPWTNYAGERTAEISRDNIVRADDGTRSGAVFAAMRAHIRAGDAVLDLGGNDGYFGMHAAAMGNRVVVVDQNEAAIARGVTRARQEPHWEIAFTVDDAARNETAADFVMALALQHHLTLPHHRSAFEAGKMLAQNARRVLITEFMPWGLSIRQRPPNLPEDYTLENFVAGIREHLPDVEVAAERRAEAGHPRVLIVARKAD